LTNTIIQTEKIRKKSVINCFTGFASRISWKTTGNTAKRKKEHAGKLVVRVMRRIAARNRTGFFCKNILMLYL
jgi:hypothetical protein